MGISLVGWLVLGVIAAGLERSFLRREPGSFLGSLLLAWCGVALGNLLSYSLGWGEISTFNLRTMAVAALGIVLILGGIRLVYRLRSRT